MPFALLVLVGQLHTDVALSQRIGPGWPKVRVTLKNEGAAPLPLMRFQSDACFAAYSLSITLDEESEPGPCPIRSWPGVAFELQPGASETRELDLAKVFPGVKAKRGHHLLFVQWAPYALGRMFDGGYAPKSESQTSSGLEFVVAAPLGKLKAVRGKPVTLPDGAKLTLVRHGHKETMAGGPESPLIMHLRFAAPGKKELEEEARVYFDEGRVFEVTGGWTFELGKYEYDAYMELTYYGYVAPPPD